MGNERAPHQHTTRWRGLRSHSRPSPAHGHNPPNGLSLQLCRTACCSCGSAARERGRGRRTRDEVKRHVLRQRTSALESTPGSEGQTHRHALELETCPEVPRRVRRRLPGDSQRKVAVRHHLSFPRGNDLDQMQGLRCQQNLRVKETRKEPTPSQRHASRVRTHSS